MLLDIVGRGKKLKMSLQLVSADGYRLIMIEFLQGVSSTKKPLLITFDFIH